jgi:hypothetical protein
MSIMYSYEDIKPSGMVDVWDLGPERPTAPDAPAEPKKTGRAADDAVAGQEYEDAIAEYKKDLKTYTALKREYDEHRANVGGALKVEMWPTDANDAILNHPGRWAKTLPPGAKPGKGQAAAEELAAKRGEEIAKIKERDPHMGTGKGSSS